MHLYSASTNRAYHASLHAGQVPADAKPITDAQMRELIDAADNGLLITPAPDGLFMVLPAPPVASPSASTLCAEIDAAADAARRAVAGDPLRAVEYDRAASEAQAFAAAEYQGEAPPMVAAWAINGRTAQQAADDILREAAQYNGALVQLRTVRLQAKEQIRTFMAANQIEEAQLLAEQTIAAIEAAVSGIGNAGA
jgi:hypothetical protein